MSFGLFGLNNLKKEDREILDNKKVFDVLNKKSSELKERLNYRSESCSVFKGGITEIKDDPSFLFYSEPEAKKKLSGISDNLVQRVKASDSDNPSILTDFKKKRRIALVFSGGPAPGGHNVIAGLFDAIKKANPESELFAFIKGPQGILEGDFILLDKEKVDAYRNLGGFSMIHTGRTKIDSEEKIGICRKNCKKMGIDALVIVGGDDSNTNAAFLAEAFLEDKIQVIGVPKTIDGDIQVKDADGKNLCAISFGFHTASLAFARNIANLCTDASSDVKYWHICKVMGRVASHLALEIALQVHPTLSLIGEELLDFVDEERLKLAEKKGEVDYTAYGMTLRRLSREISDIIVKRAAIGKNYGVIVIPEGILEFINEIQILIIKLSSLIAEYNKTHDLVFHKAFENLASKIDFLRRMAREAREKSIISIWNTRDHDFFEDLPVFFQEGLLMERDSHGNFQFSQLKTELIIMELVQDYLAELKEKGIYKLGISPDYYKKSFDRAGLDPDLFAPVLFRNFDKDESHLLLKEEIISLKTLRSSLERAGLITKDEDIPEAVLNIYRESEADFRVQSHFYGYDGRGSDPSTFDCNYTYNLGLTAFSLIAGGATGQMAVIANLEEDFFKWEPMGVPLAALMHLEERKGRMELVMEKKLVDINGPAFRFFKLMRREWAGFDSKEDLFRRPDSIWNLEGFDKPLTLDIDNIFLKKSQS